MWRDGTYLGISRISGEALVGTKDGDVVKVRSIRRRPNSERWSHEDIKNIAGTPLKPSTKTDDIEVQSPEDEIQVRVSETGVGMKMPEGRPEDQT
eukprot:1621776-Karenia_brevis.AAC.1